MEEERRELCPYCSRPLMKSRRLKFQGGQWRCAHCGAPWPGELELDLDTGESEGEEAEEVEEAEEANTETVEATTATAAQSDQEDSKEAETAEE